MSRTVKDAEQHLTLTSQGMPKNTNEVKKESDAEGSDFYYLGQVIPIEWTETITYNNAGKELPIMNFVMELEIPVRDDMYEYFTGINTL